jgi:hypothetical protein
MYELLVVDKYGRSAIETLDTEEECEELLNFTAEYKIAFIYKLTLVKTIRGTGVSVN